MTTSTPLTPRQRRLLRDLSERGYVQGLESFLMTRGDITVATSLVRRGLVERGTFDGVGGGKVYRIKEVGQHAAADALKHRYGIDG